MAFGNLLGLEGPRTYIPKRYSPPNLYVTLWQYQVDLGRSMKKKQYPYYSLDVYLSIDQVLVKRWVCWSLKAIELKTVGGMTGTKFIYKRKCELAPVNICPGILQPT